MRLPKKCPVVLKQELHKETKLEQFKTTDDLREYVKSLGKFKARPAIKGEHPTLYLNHEQGIMHHGVREKDYFFSTCRQWVLPHPQMGLSFSGHWSHLKDILRIKTRHGKGNPVSVFWILEAADIPNGLKFEVDTTDNKHFLLTVTEKMLTTQLAKKLSWVADRMTEIKDARKAL